MTNTEQDEDAEALYDSLYGPPKGTLNSEAVSPLSDEDEALWVEIYGDAS